MYKPLKATKHFMQTILPGSRRVPFTICVQCPDCRAEFHEVLIKLVSLYYNDYEVGQMKSRIIKHTFMFATNVLKKPQRRQYSPDFGTMVTKAK